MVISNLFFRKNKWVAVACMVIAVLFLLNVSVGEAKISDSQFKKIKTIIDVTNFPELSNYTQEDLREVLDKPVKSESDITYGVLILSTWNELEFIDMILSQAFLDKNKAYFNNVLDERLNLLNHWKKVGKNMYEIWRKAESVTPISALALESLETTNKMIEIFLVFNVWRNTEIYKGLWRYFDFRTNGETHKVAWENARAEISIGVNSSHVGTQFAALWDKWGPYVEPFGISEEAKAQVRNDLQKTLILGIESFETKPGLAQTKPSLVATAKQSWDDLISQLQNIENNIKKLAQDIQADAQIILNQVQSALSKLTVFSPAAVIQTQPTEDETTEPLSITETEERLITQSARESDSAKPGLAEEEEPVKVSLADLQEELDDILEIVDVINQEVSELSPAKDKDKPELLQEEGTLSQEEGIEVGEEIIGEGDEEDKIVEDTGTAFILCDKTSEPARDKVIFNEIAWMGGVSSANDEWIELKNISGTQVDLANWRLMDKNEQIDVAFGAKVLLANEIFLLERTNDDSVPLIAADLIYTGSLSNEDEALYLFDENCQLQDRVLAMPEWPKGENDSKRTMERRPDLSWQSSWETGGTPGQETGMGFVRAPTGGDISSQAPTSVSEEPAPQLAVELLISEVQIETASSTDHDFIEIYNPGASSVDISNFQLTKKSSTGNEYSVRVFPTGSMVSAQDYFLWANSAYASSGLISASATSSQTLAKNNSLALLDNNDNLLDAVAWGTSTNPFVEGISFSENPGEGQSLGRKWSTTSQNYIDTGNNQDDFEIHTPTPAAQNQSPEPEPESQPEEPSLTVIINEIAWMGTSATNSADEWIELYNNSTSSIDLTGWSLEASDGTPSIIFSTSTISAQSYFLLERTDEDTVSDVSADLIYTGALGNEGEILELRNASNTLIDLVDCSSGWFAGSTTPAYISMERVSSTATGTDSDIWANNNLITRNGKNAENTNINGTPKAENSISQTETQVANLPFSEFDEITFTYLGNPYVVNNNLTIPEGKTLLVEPGVSLKFQQERGLVIEGTLLAQGEESNKINFAPLVESNHWSSIYFSSSSQDSILDNCLIKNTGQNPDNLAIKVDSTSITLRNSKIENTTVQVLKLINSSSTIENLTIERNTTGKAIEILGGAPEIRNSTITDTYAGIFVEQESRAVIENNYFEGINYPLGPLYVNGAQPVLKNNNGASNVLNRIYLNGTVSNDWQLYKNEIPYILALLSVAADKTLEIKAGVVIELKPLSGKMEINGILKAIGEEDNKITFTSPDLSSKWDTIRLTSQEATSTLKYVVIKYGGKSSAPTKGALSIEDAKVEFRDLLFDNNYYSLYFKNASSSVISDSEFTNCYRGILIEGDCPQRTNLTLNCTCNFASPSLSCSATSSSICP